MNPGEVILAHHIRQIAGQDDKGKPTLSLDYSAPKGSDFVFVFLGIANREGEPFKVEEAMKRLGWKRG